MHTADWTVLITYLVGTVLLGIFLGKLIRNPSDMFAAGGKSPWWTSGLSAFMTMFSANTFVVWGGLAYQYGVVAILVNLCYGLAALLAGFTVAGKWKRLGIRTPAEYVEKRFGVAALHFYTWAMMIFRIVGAAGALYAIATLIVAVTGGSDTAKVVTGLPPKLVTAILVFGAIVVLYTMIGGLWAVLMTDVLQFIILNLAVIFVVVLILNGMGGFGGFLEQAPEGFLALTAPPKYTWLFLAGWVAVHYFMIGAEFAFVQRYICVPTPKDARKGAYLFGFLYLFSPFLWLLPPLLWRVQSPIPEGASPEMIVGIKETAYIQSCKSVLPVGMVGLMLAAMFSATASLISSQLNVFSGVLTNDIYRPLAKAVTEKRLLFMGRVFTVVLGVVIAGIALLIPSLGGAEKVIVAITELMVVPMLAPVLWGLLNRKIDSSALWLTAGICIPLGIALHFGFAKGGFLDQRMPEDGSGGFLLWLSFNFKTLVGVILPLVIMLLVQASAKSESPRWKDVQALHERPEVDESATASSHLPALLVGWSMVVVGAGMSMLIPVNSEDRLMLGVFAMIMALLGAVIVGVGRRQRKQAREGEAELR
ncbi:MAG: Na+:solute symporter [Verrucomicrobiota bacterium]